MAIDSREAVAGARTYTGAVSAMQAANRATQASMLALGRTISGLFLGFGAFAAIRGAVRSISQFEVQMARVRGVTKGAAEAFDELRDTALAMGQTTRFTAAEAAEGLFFLGQAGLEARQAMDLLGPVLDAATASMGDVGTIADQTTDILNQFALTASDGQRVLDVMVQQSTMATTSFQQLSDAMSFAGQNVRNVGGDVETAAAAMGVLADAGIKATRGGVALRQIILRLIDPTAEARVAIGRLGLSMDDIDPRKVGLLESFRAFREANLDLEAASKIFQARNAAAALALAEYNDKFALFIERNRGALDITREIAALQENTLLGQWRELVSTLEAASIQTGDRGLAGALKALVQTFTGAVRWLFDMNVQGREFSAGQIILAKTLQAVGAAMAVMIGIKIIGFFKGITVAVAAAVVAIDKMVFALAPLAAALGAIAVALGAFSIGTYLQEEFRIVREAAQVVVTFFEKAFIEIKFILLDAAAIVEDAWFRVLTGIRDALITVLKGARLVVPGAGESIETLQTMQGTARVTLAAQLRSNEILKQREIARVQEVHDLIMADIEEEFGRRERKGQSFFESVKKQWEDLQSTIRDTMTTLLGLKGASEGAGRTVKDVMDDIVGPGKGATDPEKGAKATKAAIEEVHESFNDFKRSAFDAATVGFGANLFDAMTDSAKNFQDVLRSLITDIGRFGTGIAIRALGIGAISSFPGGAGLLQNIGIVPKTDAAVGFNQDVTGPAHFFIEPGLRENVQIGPPGQRGVGAGGGVHLHLHNVTDGAGFRRSRRQQAGMMKRATGIMWG